MGNKRTKLTKVDMDSGQNLDMDKIWLTGIPRKQSCLG